MILDPTESEPDTVTRNVVLARTKLQIPFIPNSRKFSGKFETDVPCFKSSNCEAFLDSVPQETTVFKMTSGQREDY